MYSIMKLLIAAALGAATAAALQERRIARAHYDEAFGMLTRQGLDAKLNRLTTEVDVLFIDLDHIHELNTALGYTEVNRLVRQAFAVRASDTLIGRWQSGDELVVITRRGDGVGLSERLTARLASLGLSATIAVAAASARDAIHAASKQVQAAKANGVRGEVLRCC